jgi:Zn-dependent protease with chaperone function
MAKRSVSLDPEIYDRLSLLRAREAAKRKTELDWDTFFRLFLRRERRKREALSWAYAVVIFAAITWVLLWPVYIYAPTLIPLMWAVGLIVAAVSVYLLTPFALRKYKPFEEAPPEIRGCVEGLAAEAGLRKTPFLTISETEEVNAMTYCSLSGGRVCLTRGLISAFEEEKLSLDELRAIIAHEVGHLRHKAKARTDGEGKALGNRSVRRECGPCA